MIDKTTTLSEAVQLVRSGHILGLGGMTIYRRPVQFVRELIQRDSPPRELTLLAFTCSLASDMLVGAGMVSHSRCCYFGLESFGLAPMFTSAVSAGTLSVIEESEASIASGLRAQMAGVGFMPSQAWLGTDMFTARPDVLTITDPYTNAQVTAFPAINCDVAVIHVLEADRFGNCVLGGNPSIDFELATIARHVVITTERIVDQISTPIDIPGHIVTAIVSLPNGAWPTSCYPLYPVAGGEILRYSETCPGGFDTYLSQFLATEPEQFDLS